MRRFELGMSLDYVESWDIAKAINEIFQNALDEEIQNPDNKWYFNYDEDSNTLKIGNKASVLSTKSLLLGCSSKRSNNNTIGQHGEGYKVATIVLLREGCGVKVYNYNDKEVWTAKIIKSRRYNADIGVFDVEKMGVFKSVPEHSLIFEITNISKEVYNSIKERNLWLNEDIGEVYTSKYGRILLDEKFAGKIYVKGLYVCAKSQVTYGYDLEPSLISLDRDRGLIDSFNLQYQLGKVLASIDVEHTDFLKTVRSKWDGYYIRNFCGYGSLYGFDESKFSEVYDDALSEFKNEFGEDAIPCTDTSEFNSLKKMGYNVALVSDNDLFYITHSSSYKPVEIVDTNASLYNEYFAWFESAKSYLPLNLQDSFRELMEKLKGINE